MKTGASSEIAVIGDVVGSRSHRSRADVQSSLESALADVNERVESAQQLEPTIGDEFQGVYATLSQAVTATLLIRLALPWPIDTRFGLGDGTLEVLGRSAFGLTQDGPAWWSAREAIKEVERRQRQIPGLRTWLLTDRLNATGQQGGDPAISPDPPGSHTNSYFLCRDQLVSAFDDRERRIAWGVLDGKTLTQIAADEQVSVSAVSQRYRRGINAVIESAHQVDL